MTPIRFSHLKAMARSPLHYQHAISFERDDTPSLRLGRLVDRLLLVEGTTPCIWAGSRRGKAWEEFKAEHQGEDIWTDSELEEAAPMADSVRRHKEAWRLLQGERGVTLYWNWLGRDCRGTPDVIGADWIADLKTTRNGHPSKFGRDAIWYGYHAQLSWYCQGAALAGKPEPKELYLVSVESSPPHPVVVWRLTDRARQAGLKLCRSWMEELLVCESANQFPGYAQTTLELDVPDMPDVFVEDPVWVAA